MIILDATTKTLEIDLAGAVTTSQLSVTVNYVDVTTTTYTPGSSDTATNSTTAVTIVSAPAASTQRQVKLLTVYNADTASATVTIQLNNNATLRPLVVVILAVGSTLVYTDGEGWRVLTSAGAITTSTLSSLSPLTSAQLADALSDETGSGAAVFATSPTLVSPALGTPASGVLTNVTGLPTTGLVDSAVTLAKMANLAQDQFIGRTTASTGVPETATITAAARTVLDDVTVAAMLTTLGVTAAAQTVLDDATVAAMVDTLGGASSVGSGGLARATSPVFATQISTPAIVAPAALTITPAAGSGVNIVLSTTGDFAVNTDNLVVDTSTGKVGIGTTGPSQKLEVAGSIVIAKDSAYRSNDASGNDRWLMGVAGTSGSEYNQFSIPSTGGHLRFTDLNANELVRITIAGKVGIGTTGPTNILSLGGNSARIFWLERHTTANTAGNTLTVQAGGATASATDKAGGDLILLPGVPTGTGRANVRIRNYSRATASGTADNTAVDRLIVAGAATLTDAATSMFEVALTAGAMAGGCIIWTIRAGDGTDYQAFSGVTTFSAVNKAGTYTTTVTTNANNDAKAVSAGTLTAAFSLLDGTDKVTMQITPAGSLTETTYQMSYTLFNNSPQAITIL